MFISFLRWGTLNQCLLRCSTYFQRFERWTVEWAISPVLNAQKYCFSPQNYIFSVLFEIFFSIITRYLSSILHKMLLHLSYIMKVFKAMCCDFIVGTAIE